MSNNTHCCRCGTQKDKLDDLPWTIQRNGKWVIICKPCQEEEIKEKIKNFSGDTEYTQNITCPHCGFEDGDSWEVSPDDGVSDCGYCSLEFEYTRNVTVNYCTKKKSKN